MCYLAPGGVGDIYCRFTWLQVELETYILVLPGSRWSWMRIFSYYLAPGEVRGLYSRVTWLQVESEAYILVLPGSRRSWRHIFSYLRRRMTRCTRLVMHVRASTDSVHPDLTFSGMRSANLNQV